MKTNNTQRTSSPRLDSARRAREKLLFDRSVIEFLLIKAVVDDVEFIR